MRAAIYARVSSDEQLQGFSIAAQLRACRDFASAHDHTIAGEYVDEALSAKSADIRKRPQFQTLMADAAAHKFDLVLVHKLDRFSRNLRLLLDCFSRLADAGVELVSLSDKTAYRTPSDRLSVHVLASVAQWFSENLGAEVSKGKTERKRQGLYNGWVPFGVVKGSDGVPVPDREVRENGRCNYDGLLLAFQWAANGVDVTDIAGRLNALGFRTTGSHHANLWGTSPVGFVLRNRFYIGELPGGYPARHEVLVPVELFNEVQLALTRRSRRVASVRKGRTVYPLTGKLTCAECGSPIHLSRHTGKPRAYCAGRVNKPIGCQQKSRLMDYYERDVAGWLAALPLDAESIARAEAEASPVKLDNTERDRRRITGMLERLKELRLLGDIGIAEYIERRDGLRGDLAKLEPNGHPGALRRFAVEYGRLTAEWPSLPVEQRRQIVLAVFDRLLVRDGHVVEVVTYPEFRSLVLRSEI